MFPFFREFRCRRKLPTRLQINLLHAAMHENSWVSQPVFQLVFHLSVFTCPLQQTIRWCILPWTIHQRLVNDQVKKRCKGIGLPSITGIWPSWDMMGISTNDPLMRRDCFYVVFLSAAHVIIVCWVMTDLWMFTHQGSRHLAQRNRFALFRCVCDLRTYISHTTSRVFLCLIHVQRFLSPSKTSQTSDLLMFWQVVNQHLG